MTARDLLARLARAFGIADAHDNPPVLPGNPEDFAIVLTRTHIHLRDRGVVQSIALRKLDSLSVVPDRAAPLLIRPEGQAEIEVDLDGQEMEFVRRVCSVAPWVTVSLHNPSTRSIDVFI